MARPEPMTVDEKKALVADSRDPEKPCYLDGKRASVSGFLNDTASVRQRDGRGGVVEFAWPTVARILSTHRNFQS